MSMCAVAPFSAAMVAPALRRPWAEQLGRPAWSHHSRNLLPNPASVKARPKSLTRNVKSPHGEALLIPVPALVLRERDLAVADVLATKARNIGAPLPGEQQERERKSGFRSYWMTLFELANLFRSPCVISGRAGLEIWNVTSWIPWRVGLAV